MHLPLQSRLKAFCGSIHELIIDVYSLVFIGFMRIDGLFAFYSKTCVKRPLKNKQNKDLIK